MKIKESQHYLILLALLFTAAAFNLRAQIRSVSANGSTIADPAETPTPTNTADPTSTPDPSATPDLTPTPDPTTTPPVEPTATVTMIPPGNYFNYLPLLADLPPPAPPGCIPVPYVPVYSITAGQELAALINDYRLSEGSQALNTIPSLTQAAQRHARDMAENNFQDHIGSDGSTVGSRASDACYEWLQIGEIIGNDETVEMMAASWINSKDNRELLISTEYSDFGIGYVYNPDSTYENHWVIVFGRPLEAWQSPN